MTTAYVTTTFVWWIEPLKRVKQMGCKIPDCRKAIISADWTDEALHEARQIVPHVFNKSDARNAIVKFIKEGCK